jgi:hypothetical protein
MADELFCYDLELSEVFGTCLQFFYFLIILLGARQLLLQCRPFYDQKIKIYEGICLSVAKWLVFLRVASVGQLLPNATQLLPPCILPTDSRCVSQDIDRDQV